MQWIIHGMLWSAGSVWLAPNLLRVADMTYVSMWSVLGHVASVTHAYARRVFGWCPFTPMRAQLIPAVLGHAVWTRDRHGGTDLGGMIHHRNAGTDHTSVPFSTRLTGVGTSASVGSVGHSFDNALAETIIGVYQTELISARRDGGRILP
jgi:putative transposase